ncbi:hypothetical protein [Jannaschia sp. R86511]|uniref:hypothetical protein n=1 Tax=Jannaschia sp. R86511 TaxID=3093853 RepID=UPI0036D2E23C
MGFLSKALKSGIAVKVVNEARKPHNQQKIKDAVQSFRNRGGGQGGAARPGTTPPPTSH